MRQQSRRDVLKGIVGYAGIAAFGMANAFERSLLGARGNILSSQEEPPDVSASEYIQDGLVHMWDAIENGGYGIHDAEKRIADLVGTNDIFLADGVRYSNKAILYDTEVAITSPDDLEGWGGITDEISDLPLPGEMHTTEYVMMHMRTPSWAESDIGATWQNGYELGNNTYITVEGGFYRNSATNFRRAGYANPILEFDMFMPIAVSKTQYAWNDCLILLNGEFHRNGRTYSQVNNYPTDSKLRILGSSGSYGKRTIGFRNIRIYNRSLTEDEMAYNFSIDKVRFGMS